MFGEELASLQASLQMDNALVNLLGAPTKSNSSLVLPPSSHPFGLFGSAVFGPGLPGELGTESSDDLITPANAEVPFNGAQLPLPAAASLPPPRQQQCLFCAGLGTQGVCGPLRPVTIDGEAAAVHQLCAMWAPGCYLPQGSSSFVNLDAEARRARQRSCTACGQRGAAITCAHSGCRCAYHLPCALAAPNVLLENESYELWCPHHSDADNSDEDYAFTVPRPRRQTGGGGGSSGKRPRALVEAQRPRTDWQKRDEYTWLKVVPPWWCEHRTVHFATKVYKELFRSGSGAVLVDPDGTNWHCIVHSEARNDLRPQYTLRGAFAELWESLGISAGDTLLFKRDPLTGSIDMARHLIGNTKAEEAADSDQSDPSATLEGAGGRGQRTAARQEACSEQTRGQSQQGSHPNRWMELIDGWNIKTVYKSTMAHQQCPIAGWLFKKLYGRLPGEADKAAMYDPDLDSEYRFDITFISAANVHYITGKMFGGWVRDSGLQAGEQIRMRREGGRVVIQRVPSDRKVRVDFTTKAASRSTSMAQGTEEAAMAGAPAHHGQELASPPAAEALEALEALVAAAGYAGTHGTPAIQAALAGSSGPGAAAAMAAAGAFPAPNLPPAGFGLHMMQVMLPPKRRRTTQADGDDSAELLLQEQQLLMARRQHASIPAAWRVGGGWQREAAAAPASSLLRDWQPSEVHVQMFQAINQQVLARHQWSLEEQATLQAFRAKYAWLDGCGREVVYLTATHLQADKAALLAFATEVARGILTQAQGTAQQPTETTPPQLHGTPPTLVPTSTGGSPFAAAPARAAAPEQPQQHTAAADPVQTGGTAAVARVLTLEEHLGLEGAASFNLDMLMCSDREAQQQHQQL